MYMFAVAADDEVVPDIIMLELFKQLCSEIIIKKSRHRLGVVKLTCKF